MGIFFYEHKYLRDRQIDLVKNWKDTEVSNLNYFLAKKGDQVSEKNSMKIVNDFSLKKSLPLLNIKFRPSRAKDGDIIYSWGGLILSGKFIIDIDNPYSLVGYNINSLKYYKNFIKKILLSNRCLEIRCLSNACRKSMLKIFGKDVYDKCIVKYPIHGIKRFKRDVYKNDSFKLLFIGSQFEIKGGAILLKAFKILRNKFNNLHLTIISHLPENFHNNIINENSITLLKPNIKRNDIFEIMKSHNLLIHPSFMESFGMTVLEAIANSMPVITNNIYALGEMVDEENGYLLKSPISKWDEYIPNKYFMKSKEFLSLIRSFDDQDYLLKIVNSVSKILENRDIYNLMCNNSYKKFTKLLKH